MRIRGAERLNSDRLRTDIAAGARIRRFDYCLSVGLLTFHHQSDLILIPAGSSVFWRSVPYSLITLIAGWWGIPWGIVLTPALLWSNLWGGRDLTATVLQGLPTGEPRG